MFPAMSREALHVVKIMKKLLILLFIFALLVSCAPVTEGTVRVTRVIDGDTIEIAGGEVVRYIGIDTPETYPVVEPFGPEAKAKNIALVEGKLVTLEKDVGDRDRYGRLLRYVYVDGLFVNGELVRLGYARAVAYPPNTRYQWQLELLEAEAKAARRGMWAE
jgi:micrococcal nuclease